MTDQKLAVVGAGITGLTTAWELEKNGKEVVVFERKSQPGGAIRTVEEKGWKIEYGPNTIQVKNQKILKFISELGLDSSMIEAGKTGSNRFIVKDGELTKVPTGLIEGLSTSLFSTAGKLQLLKEPFVGKGNNPDESLEAFVQRRIGSEFLDYAIDPFVSGVYAGRPDQLAVRHAFPKLYGLEQDYGSLISGSIAKIFKRNKENFKTRLISFKNGLSELPVRIAEKLKNVRYEHGVTRIQKVGSKWEIQANGVNHGGFDTIFLNIPLYRINEQLIDGGGAILDVLTHAGYPPLSVIITGYPTGKIEHPLDGCGFLVPRKENRRILGTLFSSSLFPGRAPEGYSLLTTFVGGGRQPKLASMDSEKLFRLVQAELSDLIGAQGEPEFVDHIYWPKSIPHYTPQYDKVLEVIRWIEESNPGLHLIGNFRGGISVPDCIENGLKFSEKVLSQDV